MLFIVFLVMTFGAVMAYNRHDVYY